MSEFLALFRRASKILRVHESTPTVVESATRMEATGLLTKQRDQAVARSVRLFLTDRTRSVRGAIEVERKRLEQRATPTLTDEERRHLLHALSKIVTELAAVVPMDKPADELP